MAKAKTEVKTNAMRILDNLGIPYEAQSYECREFEDAGKTADLLGLPHEKVCKTLVCQGKGKGYFVFVIPIDAELDLKKAAKSVHEKSVEMIHVKDIKNITGYVRGGCTAIGMKKAYPVRIDSSAEQLPDIYVSAGRIGCQLHLQPEKLREACSGEWADLTKTKERGAESV
ncbi:MAG: Cys-tRNA(Pro) deacylase [Lachnospiraceae bacterium]|nr:Cys-tRNA(Pro) deacylase [Lachnospiraceae bacterium]